MSPGRGASGGPQPLSEKPSQIRQGFSEPGRPQARLSSSHCKNSFSSQPGSFHRLLAMSLLVQEEHFVPDRLNRLLFFLVLSRFTNSHLPTLGFLFRILLSSFAILFSLSVLDLSTFFSSCPIRCHLVFVMCSLCLSVERGTSPMNATLKSSGFVLFYFTKQIYTNSKMFQYVRRV